MKSASIIFSKSRKKKSDDDNEEGDEQLPPLPLKDGFHYEKGACALEYWEPVRLLGEGSISDIHLVKRRSKRLHVRYKKKRDIMKFAKIKAGEMEGEPENEEELFVLKSIMKDHVDSDYVLQEMRSELFTMSKLEHPNIVKLYEAYERRRHIYLVMDYCSGGDLTDRHFPEHECAVVLRKILSAVSYMHAEGVVHRDLKLENIMIDGEGQVKVIDFGLATKYLSEEHKVLTDRVGTLYTMSPQVLQGVYNSQADMWSIGVITYMLLSEVNPFWGPPRPMPWSKRRKVMIDRIMRGRYQSMTGPTWNRVSPAAKQFCTSLLQMDPKDRPTAQEALCSDWIQAMGSEKEKERVASDEDQQSRRAVSQLKRVLIQLLSQELSHDEAIKLRSALEVYDEDGDGRIELKECRNVVEAQTSVSASLVASVFDEQPLLDMTAALAYNDFCIRILADRDRTITEMTAEALDGLDAEGVRKVDRSKVLPALEAIVPCDLLEKILCDVTVDEEGSVSTIAILEMLDKSLVSDTRHSLRTIGRQDEQGDDDDLVDETNAVIPGGRTDSPQNPKYVYEATTQSMREVEYAA